MGGIRKGYDIIQVKGVFLPSPGCHGGTRDSKDLVHCGQSLRFVKHVICIPLQCFTGAELDLFISHSSSVIRTVYTIRYCTTSRMLTFIPWLLDWISLDNSCSHLMTIDTSSFESGIVPKSVNLFSASFYSYTWFDQNSKLEPKAIHRVACVQSGPVQKPFNWKYEQHKLNLNPNQ
jgi:hypothetical protein